MDLFWPFSRKAGTEKPMVSCTPNTTFHSFRDLGWEVLGNFFRDVFSEGFWDVILHIFEEIY